jgi:hypothetical protein
MIMESSLSDISSKRTSLNERQQTSVPSMHSTNQVKYYNYKIMVILLNVFYKMQTGP